MNRHSELSILIAHEDPVVEAGLAAVLRDLYQSVVCLPGAIRKGATANAVLADADVIVADYRNAIDWLQETSLLQERIRGKLKVLIVTTCTGEWEVQQALKLGASGYLQQGCPTAELIYAVNLVARGSRFLSQSVAQCVAEGLTHEQLTSRERDVLRLLAEGMCNKRIARELGIMVGTVKTHVTAILVKLGVATRTHAAAVAVRRGLAPRHELPTSSFQKTDLGHRTFYMQAE